VGGTAEEKYAAAVADAYAKLIVEKGWYEFGFAHALKHLWTDVPLFGPGVLRKWERRVALSGEYAIKAVYATMIGIGTSSAYEADVLPRYVVAAGWSDSLAQRGGVRDSAMMSMHRVEWLDRRYALLMVQRYTPYRDALLALAQHADRVRLAEISGNRLVTFTGTAPRAWSVPSQSEGGGRLHSAGKSGAGTRRARCGCARSTRRTRGRSARRDGGRSHLRLLNPLHLSVHDRLNRWPAFVYSPIGTHRVEESYSPTLLFLLLALTNAQSLASQGDYAAPILAGISNHGRNAAQPYVTAGDRAYLIGTQDGNFPDMGGHLQGEMGGLWLHPIKLIDGFWAEVTDVASNQHVALSQSSEFINYPYGNLFRYGPVLDGVHIERFQFSPEGQPGVIVRYTIENATDRERQLRFQLSVKTDLRPVWFSEHLGITDARDTVAWSSTNDLFVAKDTKKNWFCVWGAVPSAGAERVARPSPIATQGDGVTAASSYGISVDPHGTATLTFVIAGSTTSRTAAVDAYRYLARHSATLETKNVAHYASLINRARVTIPDKRLQEVYNWSRINMEWLVRDVPGMGRGLGAGLMEYPWWFGTETYSLQALAATGDFDLAKQDLRLLNAQSMKANGNGRILHEITTNGGVVNPGNTQETAQFIMTVGRVVDWTGDSVFARAMYPAMTRGIHWLLEDRDQNKDLFPEGYGITEILGLNAEVIDVAVYTQQALEATAHVSATLGKSSAARHYQRLASELKARINRKFWLEDERSYGDFYGSRLEAMNTAEGSVKQIRLKGDSNLTRSDTILIRTTSS
jgi:Glycogen debranching enzyme